MLKMLNTHLTDVFVYFSRVHMHARTHWFFFYLICICNVYCQYTYSTAKIQKMKSFCKLFPYYFSESSSFLVTKPPSALFVWDWLFF